MENNNKSALKEKAESGRHGGSSVDTSAGDTLLTQMKVFIAVLSSAPRRSQFLALTVSILAVICLTVVGQLRLNAWFKDFYDAIEGRHLNAFWSQLVVFTIIVSVLLILNVTQTWLDRMIKLRVRERLTRELIAQWLSPKREFLLPGAGLIGRNPDQRIHEDVNRLSELSAALAIGLIQAVLLLVSFIGVLWVLSEGVHFTLNQHTFFVPGYMVWCALLYAAIGSLLSLLMGRRLVPLNAERYAREADLRFALVRTNENVDGIALYRGEAREESWLNAEIDSLLAVIRRIVGATTRLTWVTAGYGWFAIVIPIVAAAPGYFQGHLTFGDLMMVAGAFNQVQQSLRWFVDNFGTLADWRATLRRVISLRQCLLKIDELRGQKSHIAIAESLSDKIILENLVVALPDGCATLEPGLVEISPGDRALILGRAGAGKSFLFRAIAGLWPRGSGTILIPLGARLAFLPQRPYVPPGTLKEALCYPLTPKLPDEASLVTVLKRVGLVHLIPSLNIVKRWDKDLPIESQQRLAFARLLLDVPTFVFLDEAFDIIDDESRELITSIFKNELAQAAIVVFSRNATQNGGFKRLARLVREAQSHPGSALESRNA